MTRVIILNCDGTWNGRTDVSATNVLRFHQAAIEAGHVSAYFAGPGDEDENDFFGHLFGGVFGLGSSAIVDKCIVTLQAIYQTGDRIYITGFSRGASNARRIASELCKLDFDVEALFLWDTVHAMLPFGQFQQDTLFGDLHIHENVKHAFHALALDEDRETFEPNLMEPREGIKQVAFKGNHADVGGGYRKRGYADISLRWMCQQAYDIGLSINPQFLPTMIELHREDWNGRRSPRVFPPYVKLFED